MKLKRPNVRSTREAAESSSSGGSILLPVALLCFLILVEVWDFATLEIVEETVASLRSTSWVEIDANVIERGKRSCRRPSQKGGKGYVENVPFVRYEYAVNGNVYSSHRVRWVNHDDPCQGATVDESDLYYVGDATRIKARVNLDDPTESVLRPGLQLGLIGWLMLIGAAIWFLFSLMAVLFEFSSPR